MRYLYASFKGYIGFYNGLGLDKVEIDFSKCKTNIVLITGINGSGKSTLLHSLDLFPDPSSAFTPNVDAEKRLKLFKDGDIYDIRITSPSDNRGGRKQAKASIRKNGVELNENGNITSYKEIIFSEFELDSNYISLSMLSGNDRGLGDKTPADRKRFASSIVTNMEVYNNLHKTLNKKSSIFKANVNNLHTKIQNIGSKEVLESSLVSLRSKENEIKSRILDLNNRIVSIETRISIDQSESDRIKDLHDRIESCKQVLQSIKNSLNLFKHKTQISEEEVETKLNENLMLLDSYKSKIEEIRLLWTSKSERMISLSDSIQSLEAQVSSYLSNIDDALESRFNESNLRLRDLKNDIARLKVKFDMNNLDYTIFQLSSLLDFYNILIQRIQKFYDGLDESTLKYIVIEFDHERTSKLTNELNSILQEIELQKDKLDSTRNDLKSVSVLSSRPKECKINTCPFIAESYQTQLKVGDIDLAEELSKIQKVILGLTNKVTEIQEMIEISRFCDSKYMELDIIRTSILEKREALTVFGDSILTSLGKFNEALSRMDNFNEQRDPSRLIEALNSLKSLKSELETNNTLSTAFESYKEKMKLISSTTDMISEKKSEIESLTMEVSKLKTEMDGYTNLINRLNSSIESLKAYSVEYKKFLDQKVIEKSLEDENAEFMRKSSDAIKSMEVIEQMRGEINVLNNELIPITNQINSIAGQITLLSSYYKEYEEYNKKYTIIETLKKYCSPTAGGIQTIFMQLYMSKTLDLANEVLGMLFGGEYRLLDFVINEKEFRIPFVGSGLPVDDISSGSTSQICIMGMVINLVLLYQASTKFNIARLDEIDGGLDHRNRFEFVNALKKAMPILNIEQLIMISHSMEADTSSVDIIKLKSYTDFEDTVNHGNVIYDYNEELQKTFN